MNRNKLMAGLLAALMALLPVLALAEGNYAAGQLLSGVAQGSYNYGNRIAADVTFGLDIGAYEGSKRAEAAASLLEKCEIALSFYDDYGTAQIHGVFSLDGVELLEGTILLPQDGSLQLQTNLTGNNILTLPAGTLAKSANFQDVFYGSIMRRNTDVKLSEMSARERLRATSSDVMILVFNHLLGWTSYRQMDRDNELYTFDDTFFEETETRDAVEQRMIGRVYASEFTELLWNILATIDAEMGDFQQAVADVLAEAGVTRTQARQVIDALFTKETIDPAKDFVQPSHAIPDDGALCTYNDVSYFFKKAVKCADQLWEDCTEEELSLIVSYDTMGRMVGFDAVLPKFTENLPYEGNYSWSLRTDDYGQERQTIHGELELYEGNRIVGDAVIEKGQDVDGVCQSGLAAVLDLVNREAGTSQGIAIDGALTAMLENEAAADAERLAGSGTLSLRANGEEIPMLVGSLSARTRTEDGVTFTSVGDIDLASDGVAMTVHIDAGTTAAEELTLTAGPAMNIAELDGAQLETLKDTVKNKAAALAPKLLMHPAVLSDLTKLLTD